MGTPLVTLHSTCLSAPGTLMAGLQGRMKAVILSGTPSCRAGITEHLSVAEDVEKPGIKSDQVLVRVKATALNIEDIMIGAGERPGITLKPTKEAPVVPGQEFAGIVEQIGSKVKNFKPGDAVLGHKMPLRVRYGSWAEFVAINESCLLLKPDHLSFSEAAGLPMSALVAYGALKAAGLISLPVLETTPGKIARVGQDEVETTTENPTLLVRKGSSGGEASHARVAVVGASSTIGLIIMDMMVSRGGAVVGVCSSSSAPVVLSAGAAAVLDRNKGGLDAKGELSFEVVIDCVGGQAVEDTARRAMEGSGHFVTIVGGGDDTFTEGAENQLAHAGRTMLRSFKSIFSKFKYSLGSPPMTGGVKVLKQLVKENVKCVVDSEVEMFNVEALLAAIDKVNAHKTKGRLVLTN